MLEPAPASMLPAAAAERPVFATELLARFWPEAEPLMRAHCEEVGATNEGTPFQFDLAQAQALEAAGMLLIVSARCEGALCAYCVWFLTRNLISSTQPIALQSGWYVVPAKRNSLLGLQLFRFALRELRRRGLAEAWPHFWGRSLELEAFFTRLGGTRAETSYRIPLGKKEHW